MNSSKSNRCTAGECVIDACPKHLLPVAVRTAIQCIKRPGLANVKQQQFTAFPCSTIAERAAASLDSAIAHLLAKEPKYSEFGLQDAVTGKYRPFDVAVSWGVLIQVALEDDMAGGATSEQALRVLTDIARQRAF